MDTQTTKYHTLLKRFLMLKPRSFDTAQSPIEAENWIVHVEGIFEKIDCDEECKVKLATQLLKGTAQYWWNMLKGIRGEENYEETMEWVEFRESFYHQYFPSTTIELIIQDYYSIRQRVGETITMYTDRFTRLAGLMGRYAGSQYDQANKFMGTLLPRYKGIIGEIRCMDMEEAFYFAMELERGLTEEIEKLGRMAAENRNS